MKSIYGWLIQHDAATLPRWLWLMIALGLLIDIQINVSF